MTTAPMPYAVLDLITPGKMYDRDGHALEQFHLPYTEVYVGRDKRQADVRLEEKLVQVDPKHFVIGFNHTTQRYYIVDLHSRYGTTVNKIRLVPEKKLALNAGDEIELGQANQGGAVLRVWLRYNDYDDPTDRITKAFSSIE